MNHFFTIDQLSSSEIIMLLKLAKKYKSCSPNVDKKIFGANLFFEPSTRTKMSFIVAQRKLGIDVLDFNESVSSTKKGESLYDTAKTFEAIGANFLVIRHQSDRWMDELKDISIPIINAGAGKSEHPTQCLLDLLTIYDSFEQFKELKISIVGDIKHSRVAHSNIKALQKLGADVYVSAPPGLEDDKLTIPNITVDQAVELSDVVMLLRVQSERHIGKNETKTDYLEKYGLTKLREKRMKKNAIILHPAPINRGIEIDSTLVECDRSRIFNQMENGVYVRMALMMKLLQDWGVLKHENVIEERNAIR